MTDAYSLGQLLGNRIAQTPPVGDSSNRVITSKFITQGGLNIIPANGTTQGLNLSFGGANALLPPTQNTPVSGLIVAGGSYADSGSGNIFQVSSWADNTGTRPTVAVFGQGRALGTSGRVWGGNFVAYAGATSAFGQAVEIDFGVTAGITNQQANGISINCAGSTGAGNLTVGISFDQLGSAAIYTDAIRFGNFAGGQPFSNALININAQTTPLTPAFGINFANATFGTAAWKSVGCLIDPSGNVTMQNMTAVTIRPINVVAQNVQITADFATNPPQTISSTSGTATSDTVLLTATGTVTLTLPSSPLTGQWQTITWKATATTVNSASSNIVPLLSTTAISTILNSGGPTKWCDLKFDGVNWQVLRGA